MRICSECGELCEEIMPPEITWEHGRKGWPGMGHSTCCQAPIQYTEDQENYDDEEG